MEKYGKKGYLKLYLPESPNVAPLKELRTIIENEVQLRQIFEEVWQSTSR